ncbi:hypothetical protein L7F22_065548 [Adiantum nelumboides]|nr:hypothetical protein [Adiantum nelumboides]
MTMGESTGEPTKGAKEQSGSKEQLSGQALGMEKVGDKRPTTAPVEALGDAPKDLLSKFCRREGWEENKFYKEMEQEHISAIRKALGKEEAAVKKIKELRETLQIGSEQLEKLKVEKAGLEKEQGKLLATQEKLMDRRREDHMAFSRKDHILKELKANHDELKGLLLTTMVWAEALHQENTLLKSEQGDDEDDVLMLPIEDQQLITSVVEAKLTTVWDDTMRRLAGEKWSDLMSKNKHWWYTPEGNHWTRKTPQNSLLRSRQLL